MDEPTLPSPAATETNLNAAPQPAAAHARRSQRVWRTLAALFVVFLFAMLTVLGSAWWWSGQADSLATALTRIARWLPAGHTLEARDVSGTLRSGGHIGWLRWRGPTLTVEVEKTEIGWNLQPLLRRAVHLGKLHAQRLQITSLPDDSPPKPLQHLRWPLRVQLPFQIDALTWNGSAPIEHIQGSYRYDGSQHQLQLTRLDWAQGSYHGELQLQGAAPMQLQAQLSGSATLPAQNQTIAAQVKVNGQLATEAARLHITADAQASGDANVPGLHATATVRPWLAQPLEQLQARLTQLDLASFWPQGPHTQLAGSLQAGPQEDGSWALQTQLSNAAPGAWDQQRLPLSQLQAQIRYASGVWQVLESRADVGAGHLSVQGRFTPKTRVAEGRADLVQLSPADLWSTLSATPIQGQLQATAREDQSVHFVAAVQASNKRRVQDSALTIDKLNAQGEWQAPWLRLHDVHIDALQASLRSKQLEIEIPTGQIKANAQAQMPGGKLDFVGRIGRDNGAGQADFALTSAPALLQWLRRLPLLPQMLPGASVEGQGEIAVQWQGGWGRLLERWQAPAGQLPQASGLQLQASVKVPKLRYLPPESEPIAVQALELTFKGQPEQAHIQLQAKGQLGERSLQINTALDAGLSRLRNAAASDWQAHITRLQAQLELDPQFPGPWTLQLLAPLNLRQTSPGQTVRSAQIQASANVLTISPPSPYQGQGRIEWQDLLARSQASGWAIKTQGRLLSVPLAWVDAFSAQGQDGLLSQAGISGNLQLNGDWNIDSTGAQLQAHMTLARADGDIRIAVDDGNTANIMRSSGPTTGSSAPRTRRLRNAGMRARIEQAQLQIQAQGDEIKAQLLWKSERAGNIQADLTSRLARSNGSWVWPEDAPLAGRISAQMPDIGIWSLFAPPGWRTAGTFSADARLSGSRLEPRWQGSVEAHALAITSLLDGVDLKNGHIKGNFSGNQLNLTQIRMEGGQGSSVRILGYSGNRTSAPSDGGELLGQGSIRWDRVNEGSGLHMQFNAQARRLQVLVRADRQLSVSGNLQALLEQGQWTLRGKLSADRAAILLAEESAPTLDSDVIIVSAAARKAQQEAQARQAKAEAAKPADIAVSLDLGSDFALQGMGLTTRLRGELELLSPLRPGGPPRITGEVQTEQGRYRAWGQSLDIESGVVRFNGSYDNPSLSILAIRPNITVRAGVQVTGSANDPRVRLYSEPDMPDAEKLSWVAMGRDPAQGGAEGAVLQQAALALLSGQGSGKNFAGHIGLDEIGFKGPNTNKPEEGSALTLGKRLSKDLYLSYEQSLSGAMGTLYIFYDLSRRLTLRGQTGEKSAVDLIYTVRKD